jgi:LuxR family transcriptional regulator, maltose regulon positive regulatory protein
VTATSPRRPAPRADARLTIPSPLRGLAERPRLSRMIDGATTVPLTLVSAPAGSGKTVLVSSWAAARPDGPPAWVSLDEDDLGDGSVWPLLVEALAQQDVAPVPLPHDGSRAFLVALAGQLCALGGPVVLVLDCDAPVPLDVAGGLEVLLRRSCGRLRLVLLTRVDPLLPLHRYRLAGSMREIRSGDLAFTGDEAEILLRLSGLDLSAAALARVMDRTRGWAAGLRFTALMLSSSEDSEAAALSVSGDHGTVSEYLLAEVLDRQPRSTRELLLRTSVVDVVVPGLAEALAGPSASRELAALAHADVFLEEAGPGCYRYHPLFRELLHAQLSYEAPADETQLHRLGAEWLAAHGAVEASVRHAVAAASWEDACRYVVESFAAGRLLAEGPAGALHQALADLPPEAPGQNAALVRAALTEPAPGAPRWRPTAEERENTSGAAQLAGWLLALRDAAASGDVSAALTAAEGGQRAAERLGIERSHPEVRTVLSWGRGTALLRAGRVDDAVEAFTVAARSAAPGGELLAGDSLGQLALVAASRGQLQRATGLASQSLELCRHGRRSTGGTGAAAEVALSWVSTEMGEFPDARVHATRARADGPSTGPLPGVMLAVATARVRRARGDVAGAEAVLTEAAGHEPRPPRWMLDLLYAEEATTQVAGGDPGRALDTLARVGEGTSPAVALAQARAHLAGGHEVQGLASAARDRTASLAARVDYALVEAARLARHAEERGARQSLGDALELAAPQLLRRPFYEAAPEVKRLLRVDPALAARHRWLVRETSPVAPRPGAPRPSERPSAVQPGRVSAERTVESAVEPLTDKEMEVLAHLAELLTTEEIAQSMFISVNTVRTHVRNILRKLVVSRRHEAVRKARSLQLIPS